MKIRLAAATCLVLLLFLVVGCEEVDPYKFHPPAWIHGEWHHASDPAVPSFTFTATTVIQTVGNTSLDLGEYYRVSDTPVAETITDTLYAFRVPTDMGWMRMKFEALDDNTINMTMETNLGNVGPTPLQRF
jgi:hypothetical protein